jgi:hypothetical protein
VNKAVTWALCAAALIIGWSNWGWQGVVLALTVIAFVLLLQFSRVMRVMRRAARRPLGHVDSAVMLNARLQPGLELWEVVRLAGSVGRPLDGRDDRFAWADPGGAQVRVELAQGRVREWRLERPLQSSPPAEG